MPCFHSFVVRQARIVSSEKRDLRSLRCRQNLHHTVARQRFLKKQAPRCMLGALILHHAARARAIGKSKPLKHQVLVRFKMLFARQGLWHVAKYMQAPEFVRLLKKLARTMAHVPAFVLLFVGPGLYQTTVSLTLDANYHLPCNMALAKNPARGGFSEQWQATLSPADVREKNAVTWCRDAIELATIDRAQPFPY